MCVCDCVWNRGKGENNKKGVEKDDDTDVQGNLNWFFCVVHVGIMNEYFLRCVHIKFIQTCVWRICGRKKVQVNKILCGLQLKSYPLYNFMLVGGQFTS